MILADTSVWIDHLRDLPTPQVARLRAAMKTGELLVADITLYEIAAGARSDAAAATLREALAPFPVAAVGGADAAYRAAGIYRRLRALGFTPRSPVDVLIASYCLAHDLPLLHSDRDFVPMHTHLGLKAA